jgi:hypothetical protein
VIGRSAARARDAGSAVEVAIDQPDAGSARQTIQHAYLVEGNRFVAAPNTIANP